MQEDNVYKGSVYTGLNEPEETKNARKAEESAAIATSAGLEKAVDSLTKRIAFYDTLSSIPDEVISDEQAFRETVAVNKQTVANLNPILQELEDLLKTYKR